MSLMSVGGSTRISSLPFFPSSPNKLGVVSLLFSMSVYSHQSDENMGHFPGLLLECRLMKSSKTFHDSRTFVELLCLNKSMKVDN